MLDRHEPDKQFSDNLEWQIGSEARRRNRSATSVHPLWRLARVATVVVLSMTLGAAAMGASYQIEESWRKELLVTSLEVRLQLARQRIVLAAEEVARVQRQFDVGALGEETLASAQLQLADLESRVRMQELDYEEVSASGREPLNDISSPLVTGRDFVSERIELEVDLMDRHLELAMGELQRQTALSDVGFVSGASMQSAELAVEALQVQRRSLWDRLEHRESFLAGDITAVEAELQILGAEAENKAEILRYRVTAMATEVEDMRSRARVGVVGEATARLVELQLAEVEAELRLAELEIEIVRRELEARRQQ